MIKIQTLIQNKLVINVVGCALLCLIVMPCIIHVGFCIWQKKM